MSPNAHITILHLLQWIIQHWYMHWALLIYFVADSTVNSLRPDSVASNLFIPVICTKSMLTIVHWLGTKTIFVEWIVAFIALTACFNKTLSLFIVNQLCIQVEHTCKKCDHKYGAQWIFTKWTHSCNYHWDLQIEHFLLISFPWKPPSAPLPVFHFDFL